MGADGKLAYQVSGSRGAGCGVWFPGESVLVKDPEVTPRRGTNVQLVWNRSKGSVETWTLHAAQGPVVSCLP